MACWPRCRSVACVSLFALSASQALASTSTLGGVQASRCSESTTIKCPRCSRFSLRAAPHQHCPHCSHHCSHRCSHRYSHRCSHHCSCRCSCRCSHRYSKACCSRSGCCSRSRVWSLLTSRQAPVYKRVRACSLWAGLACLCMCSGCMCACLRVPVRLHVPHAPCTPGRLQASSCSAQDRGPQNASGLAGRASGQVRPHREHSGRAERGGTQVGRG